MARRCSLGSNPIQGFVEADVLGNGVSVRAAAKKYGLNRSCIYWHLTRHPSAAWNWGEFLQWEAPGTLTAARARFSDPVLQRLQLLALEQARKDLMFQQALSMFRQDAGITEGHFERCMVLLDPERLASARKIAALKEELRRRQRRERAVARRNWESAENGQNCSVSAATCSPLARRASVCK